MSTYAGPQRPGNLSISQTDDCVTVAVSGLLDRELGDQLVEVVEAALAVSPRVALQVASVHRWTWAGLDALTSCVDRGAVLPGLSANASRSN